MVRPGEVPVNAFQPRNLAHRKHGIWSRRTYEPISRELAEALIEERPDLANYPETVWSWARAEARCLLLAEWLADHPLVDAKGKPAPVSRFIVQFENQPSEQVNRFHEAPSLPGHEHVTPRCRRKPAWPKRAS